jgi:hypothetical protein
VHGALRFALVVHLAICTAFPASGAQGAASPCTAAAHRAAALHGVPADILLTIATIESGRSGGPGWPWTVGHRGSGFWAASLPDAVEHARSLIARGERNLDLGCFQINLYWHAASFASLEAMFDPDTNATHAARLLARHYARTGNWEAAVAAYHSATPVHAARYIERFHAARRGGPVHAPAPPVAHAANRPPGALALLAAANEAHAAGSLVRAGHLGRRLIGGAP